MKKTLCVLLSVLFLLSGTAVAASAAQIGDTGSFSAFCYNVAGQPDLSSLTGGEPRDVPSNQEQIGRYVTAQGYDIFAVQEDFGYHDNLVGELPDYRYRTVHHGMVPAGDGTNTYTKAFPMYNEAHIPWNTLYGVAGDGADEFSQKGITYTCMEIASGVYVDFYNIHADAYGDEGSVAARIDNFTQLRDLINGREVDRPVIVTGDFNAFLFNDRSQLKTLLVDGAGLKDAWVECKNNGDYEDCSYYIETCGGAWTDKWGVWDSVERFMYKDGGGVSLECASFEYVTVYNRDGKSCSDHTAALAAFDYTVTDEIPQGGLEDNNYGLLGKIKEMFRRIVVFFKALVLGFKNLDKIRDYLKK